MRRARLRRAAPLLSLLLFAGVLPVLPACGASRTGRDPGPNAGEPVFASAPVEIVGIVLDAISGKPLAGCRVTGPGGLAGLTDEEGRFHIKGSLSGVEGELVATAPDGRTGANQLRPLLGRRLEVVVYVR